MKFYNIDAPETPGTTTTSTATYQSGFQGFVPNVNSSIAEAMAKQGQRTEDGFTAARPEVNMEATVQATTDETPTSAVPAAEANADVQAQTEPSTTATQEPSQSEAAIAPPAPVVPTWQEVLKQQPNDVVLKELGFDDTAAGFVKGLKEVDPKMVAFLQHWQSGGDVSEYLRALSTDYKSMQPEDVMRHQLRRDYPRATDRQLELLYEEEVVKKYNLDSDDPDEAERGKLLLEAKTDRYRDELARENEKLLLPKPPEKKEAADPTAQNAQVLADAEQVFTGLKQKIEVNPSVKSLLQKGSLTVGEGEEAFNYPLANGGELLNSLYRVMNNFIAIGEITKESAQALTDDFVDNQLLIGAFSRNPKAFLKDYAQHIKSLGGKQVLDVIENVKVPDGSNPSATEIAPTNAAAAMARGGRITVG